MSALRESPAPVIGRIREGEVLPDLSTLLGADLAVVAFSVSDALARDELASQGTGRVRQLVRSRPRAVSPEHGRRGLGPRPGPPGGGRGHTPGRSPLGEGRACPLASGRKCSRPLPPDLQGRRRPGAACGPYGFGPAQAPERDPPGGPFGGRRHGGSLEPGISLPTFAPARGYRALSPGRKGPAPAAPRLRSGVGSGQRSAGRRGFALPYSRLAEGPLLRAPGLASGACSALLAGLEGEGALERSGPRWVRPGPGPKLGKEKARLETLLTRAGAEGVEPGRNVPGQDGRTLKTLCALGRAVSLDNGVFWHRSVYERLALAVLSGRASGERFPGGDGSKSPPPLTVTFGYSLLLPLCPLCFCGSIRVLFSAPR